MKGASNTGFKSICLALMGGLALSLPCLAHGGGGGGGGGGHMSGGGGHFSGSSFHSSGMSFHSSSPSFHSSGMSFHPSSTSFGGNTFRPSTSHMHSEMARESAALEAESARHGGLSSAFGALFGSHAARGLTESPASLERAEPSASEFARNESLHEGASESVKGSLTNQEALKNFETAPKSHHFLFFGKHSNATSPAALEANGNRIARPGMTTFDSAEVPTPLSGHALNESLTTNAGLAAPNAVSVHQAEANAAASAWEARHGGLAVPAAAAAAAAIPGMTRQQVDAQAAASAWATRHSGAIPGVAPAGTVVPGTGAVLPTRTAINPVQSVNSNLIQQPTIGFTPQVPFTGYPYAGYNPYLNNPYLYNNYNNNYGYSGYLPFNYGYSPYNYGYNPYGYGSGYGGGGMFNGLGSLLGLGGYGAYGAYNGGYGNQGYYGGDPYGNFGNYSGYNGGYYPGYQGNYGNAYAGNPNYYYPNNGGYSGYNGYPPNNGGYPGYNGYPPNNNWEANPNLPPSYATPAPNTVAPPNSELAEGAAATAPTPPAILPSKDAMNPATWYAIHHGVLGTALTQNAIAKATGVSNAAALTALHHGVLTTALVNQALAKEQRAKYPYVLDAAINHKAAPVVAQAAVAKSLAQTAKQQRAAVAASAYAKAHR